VLHHSVHSRYYGNCDSCVHCCFFLLQRGNSALHLACKLGLVDIVKTLCSFNADASLQNKKVDFYYPPPIGSLKCYIYCVCLHR
jgi:ankyrin repeat protein